MAGEMTDAGPRLYILSSRLLSLRSYSGRESIVSSRRGGLAIVAIILLSI